MFGGDYDPARLAGKKGGTDEHLKMGFQARRSLPSYIPAGHFASALIDLVVRGSSRSPYPAPPLSIESLRAAAIALPSEQVRRAVLSAVDLGGGDLAKVKANVEAWFDGTMDRVSGWYKRRTQRILFAIGLGVAVLLNVDAITVAERLGTDSALRGAVVQQAGAALEKGMPREDATDAASTRVLAIRDELSAVGVPMGWVHWRPGPQTDGGRREMSGGIMLQTLIGWLITATAVMLGAPFWFDVLNKFMVIRSTVKPHEKSPEEGSEDRQARSSSSNGAGVRHPAIDADVEAAIAVGENGSAPAPTPDGYEPHEWDADGRESEGII